MDNHTQEFVTRARQKPVMRWLVVAVALAIAGCAAAGLGRPDKEVVAERAQQRWDALVKNDFQRAYEFVSPAGREVVTASAYAAKLRRDFWTAAKVDRVECPAPDACEVDVTIEYSQRGFKMKTPLREKWVRQRSNWWFLLEN
jgi:hypothetical protein